jgi:hypothetical protein
MHFPIGFVKNAKEPAGRPRPGGDEAQKAAMDNPCGLMSCNLAKATA